MTRLADVMAAEWAPPPPSGVAIGVFDGVHVGHRRVLDLLADRSRRESLEVGVLTFDPHPVEVLAPGQAPALLTPLARRVELLERSGADWVGILDLADIRTMPPETFVTEILVARAHSRLVSVGADFRFGHDRAGDVDLLAKLGHDLGFDVRAVDLHREGGEVVSSSRIRQAVTAGDVGEAARQLGRWHRVSGVVLHGDSRGRTLGFPTANIAPSERVAVPADGIYAAFVSDGRTLRQAPAVVSIGVRPTFETEGGRLLEVHVFDFDGDLYGMVLDVDFVEFLRGEARFESAAALVAQMQQDADRARARLSE